MPRILCVVALLVITCTVYPADPAGIDWAGAPKAAKQAAEFPINWDSTYVTPARGQCCGCAEGLPCGCQICRCDLSYTAAYQKALYEDKPLVVWVGMKARPVAGCVVCRTDTFADVLDDFGTCVVSVSNAERTEMIRVADLKLYGPITDDFILGRVRIWRESHRTTPLFGTAVYATPPLFSQPAYFANPPMRSASNCGG